MLAALFFNGTTGGGSVAGEVTLSVTSLVSVGVMLINVGVLVAKGKVVDDLAARVRELEEWKARMEGREDARHER